MLSVVCVCAHLTVLKQYFFFSSAICENEKESEKERKHVNTCMCVLVCLHTLIVTCKSDSGERWGVSTLSLCVCVCECVCLRG